MAIRYESSTGEVISSKDIYDRKAILKEISEMDYSEVVRESYLQIEEQFGATAASAIFDFVMRISEEQVKLAITLMEEGQGDKLYVRLLHQLGVI